MKTVYSKKELDDAYASGERSILVKGEFAQQIRTKCKIKKAAKITTGLIAVAGIAAVPFTGGASLLATGAGLTAGALTISTAPQPGFMPKDAEERLPFSTSLRPIFRSTIAKNCWPIGSDLLWRK